MKNHLRLMKEHRWTAITIKLYKATLREGARSVVMNSQYGPHIASQTNRDLTKTFCQSIKAI